MRKTQLKTVPSSGSTQLNTGRKWLQSGFLLVALAFMLAMFGTVASAQSALPPAGASIGNQAAATYTDGTGQDRIATSNTVITIVRQVAGLDLVANRNKLGAPGSPVYFPHTVTNTGNGPDSYDLTVANNTGDSFDLNNLAIFADANGDGVPDSTTPLTRTPVLAAGESFSFVVSGVVPSASPPADGTQATITVVATSVFDSDETASNVDTVRITDYAIMDVTKAIDNNRVVSPTSSLLPLPTRTYTLTYINRGRAAATNVTITDTLDSRLTYVEDSGKWNNSALTDDNDGFEYAGLGGINYRESGNVVTAVVAHVEPGGSGTITFEVAVNLNTGPGVIPNAALYSYQNGHSVPGAEPDDDPIPTIVPNQPTNTVELHVTAAVSVTGTGWTVPNAPQGSIVTFYNEFTNTGTGTDTFDVTFVPGHTFPLGTSFVLYQTDNATPKQDSVSGALLLDSNGNTIPDTGPLAPGQSVVVIVKASLPPGAYIGSDFTLQKRATSVTDPSVGVTVNDVLTTITRSTVDLENGAGGPALGQGQGPEGTPVTTLTGDPGSTVRFELSVANLAAVSDNYDLIAGEDDELNPFGNGFSVVFRNTSGGVITNTGNVLPGTKVNFYADVTIPANAAPVASPGVSVYFRALSPNTGSLDIKHDAVVVNRVRSITIEPDHTGQTYAGSSIVYAHTVTNTGNAEETVTLASVNSQAANGFTSVIYWDANGDGILDPTDPQITASFPLPAGGSRDIFVKVYAPANAVPGNVDVATITASTGTGGPSDTATDTTSIVTGQLTLLKEQALDTDLDGTPEGAYGTANLAALPGEGIRYRIRVTNNSLLAVDNVIVNDSTPAFTTYHTGDTTATSATGVAVFTLDGGTTFVAGTPVPANGTVGVLGFNIGTLAPGQSAIVYFGVRVNG